MSIELIAILAGYGLTGIVWWSLDRKIDRLAQEAGGLRETMMNQFKYLVREIRRVEAGLPVPDETRSGENPRQKEAIAAAPANPRPAIAD